MNHPTTADSVAERARGAYIATVCRRDTTYAFIIASEITNPQKNDFKTPNKMLLALLSSSDIWINVVPLDLETLTLAVFVDASFAPIPD